MFTGTCAIRAGTGQSKRRETGNAAFRYALCVCEQAVPASPSASAAKTCSGAGGCSCHAGSAINSDDADWQQAPDGDVPHDTSRDTLPGTEAHEAASASTGSDDASISELLKQALKEQEQDYSQGKIPAPPVDETQDNSQRDVNHKVDARSPLSEKGDRLE